MTDLTRVTGLRIATSDTVDAVAEAAQIDELETEGEEERSEDQPDDDDGERYRVARGVVPEDQVEKYQAIEGRDDPFFEGALENGEDSSA